MNKKNKKLKQETNTCGICGRLIYFKVDDYCHLEDFHKGKFDREGWYHNKCWNDKLRDGKDLSVMKKKAFALLNKASEMIGLKDEKKMEVVYV